MMGESKKPKATERKIGSTTYLVTRSFKKNAKEDAAAKMAKVVQNEARRLLRDPDFIALA